MNIETVHGWVEEASAISLRSFNAIEARVKVDRSVVTDADDEIERLLRRRIHEAYPAHKIIGEEGGGDQSDAEYLWAIDPIDGTSNFVRGLPIWGTSIGLLQHGEPVLGCFYMPLIGDWYEADLDGPATFNGHPIHATTDDLLDSEAWLCTSSNVHRRYQIDHPGKVRSLGCLAAHLCYTARGIAAGAIIGMPYIWDMAGGLAILRRAGGDIRTLHGGEPVRLGELGRNKPREPLIAGSPPAIAMLRERVRVRG
jgi:myo-inositol-1(or 4)-monophosphatase